MEKRNVIDPDFTPVNEFTKAAEQLEKNISQVFETILKKLNIVEDSQTFKDSLHDAGQSKL